MEHAPPLDPALTWRTAALGASVLALAAGSGLLLAHRSNGTRAVAGATSPSRAPKRQAAPAAPTPLRPRSRISVLVLNGNGISGAAGGAATDLLAQGYRHAIPADASSLDYARSLVLYRPGWQREAERLGRDARIQPVAPLDGRVAPAYTHVPLVVILGAN